MEKQWKQWQALFSWVPKSLWTVTAAMVHWKPLQDLGPWKKSYDKPVCLVNQLCPTFCDPMDCSPPGRLLCPWRFSQQEYWSGLPCSPSEDLPNPGIEPRCPTLLEDWHIINVIYNLFQNLFSKTTWSNLFIYHDLLRDTGFESWSCHFLAM